MSWVIHDFGIIVTFFERLSLHSKLIFYHIIAILLNLRWSAKKLSNQYRWNHWENIPNWTLWLQPWVRGPGKRGAEWKYYSTWSFIHCSFYRGCPLHSDLPCRKQCRTEVQLTVLVTNTPTITQAQSGIMKGRISPPDIRTITTGGTIVMVINHTTIMAKNDINLENIIIPPVLDTGKKAILSADTNTILKTIFTVNIFISGTEFHVTASATKDPWVLWNDEVAGRMKFYCFKTALKVAPSFFKLYGFSTTAQNPYFS